MTQRSNQELIAYSQFVSDRNIKGAKNDDKDTLVEIEDLLQEGKFLEVHELVSKERR